jgi:hypothetical protein
MQIKLLDTNVASNHGLSEVVDKIIGYNKYEGDELSIKRVILKSISNYRQSKSSNVINFAESIAYFKDAIILINDNYYNNKALQDLHLSFDHNPSKTSSEPSSSSILFCSLYSNLIFCLNKSQDWSESLFYIREFEALPHFNKASLYFIDNYKLESLIALGKIDLAKDLATAMIRSNGSSYQDLEKKGSFMSSLTNRNFKEVSFKIALYVNVAKVQLLKSNLEEAKSTILQILGIICLTEREGDSIDLPGYLINIIVYYYLMQENHSAALKILKTHKVSPSQFDPKKSNK